MKPLNLLPILLVAITSLALAASAYDSESSSESAKPADYRRTVTECSRAIRADPSDADAYHKRGYAYCKLGQHQLARDDYTEAIKLNPKFMPAYIDRGCAYANLGLYQKSVADYSVAISLAPRSRLGACYVFRALAYELLNDHQKVIDDCSLAISLDPTDAEAYVHRGSAYCKLRFYEKAIDDCNNAIRLKPKDPEAYITRGLASSRGVAGIGGPDEIKDWTIAIGLDRKNVRAYVYRAVAYQGLHEDEKAIDDYVMAISLDPGSELADWAYGNLSVLYRASRQYQKGIDLCTSAIMNHHSVPEYYGGRASVYCELRQYKKAIDDYGMALKLNPQAAWAYRERGQVFSEMQQYEKAIDDCNMSIGLDPKDYRAYYNRGLIYGHLRQYQKDIDDCSVAIRLNPGNGDAASALSQRCWAHNELKQYSEAIADRLRCYWLEAVLFYSIYLLQPYDQGTFVIMSGLILCAALGVNKLFRAAG